MIGQSPVQTNKGKGIRKKAAVCGEERCVTTPKTAAKETTLRDDPKNGCERE